MNNYNRFENFLKSINIENYEGIMEAINVLYENIGEEAENDVRDEGIKYAKRLLKYYKRDWEWGKKKWLNRLDSLVSKYQKSNHADSAHDSLDILMQSFTTTLKEAGNPDIIAQIEIDFRNLHKKISPTKNDEVIPDEKPSENVTSKKDTVTKKPDKNTLDPLLVKANHLFGQNPDKAKKLYQAALKDPSLSDHDRNYAKGALDYINKTEHSNRKQKTVHKPISKNNVNSKTSDGTGTHKQANVPNEQYSRAGDTYHGHHGPGDTKKRLRSKLNEYTYDTRDIRDHINSWTLDEIKEQAKKANSLKSNEYIMMRDNLDKVLNYIKKS